MSKGSMRFQCFHQSTVRTYHHLLVSDAMLFEENASVAVSANAHCFQLLSSPLIKIARSVARLHLKNFSVDCEHVDTLSLPDKRNMDTHATMHSATIEANKNSICCGRP